VFSIIFIAVEIDGTGEKGSGDITMIDIHTYIHTQRPFRIWPRDVCFNNEAFFWHKAEPLVLGQFSSAT